MSKLYVFIYVSLFNLHCDSTEQVGTVTALV